MFMFLKAVAHFSESLSNFAETLSWLPDEKYHYYEHLDLVLYNCFE